MPGPGLARMAAMAGMPAAAPPRRRRRGAASPEPTPDSAATPPPAEPARRQPAPTYDPLIKPPSFWKSGLKWPLAVQQWRAQVQGANKLSDLYLQQGVHRPPSEFATPEALESGRSNLANIYDAKVTETVMHQRASRRLAELKAAGIPINVYDPKKQHDFLTAPYWDFSLLGMPVTSAEVPLFTEPHPVTKAPITFMRDPMTGHVTRVPDTAAGGMAPDDPNYRKIVPHPTTGEQVPYVQTGPGKWIVDPVWMQQKRSEQTGAPKQGKVDESWDKYHYLDNAWKIKKLQRWQTIFSDQEAARDKVGTIEGQLAAAEATFNETQIARLEGELNEARRELDRQMKRNGDLELGSPPRPPSGTPSWREPGAAPPAPQQAPAGPPQPNEPAAGGQAPAAVGAGAAGRAGVVGTIIDPATAVTYVSKRYQAGSGTPELLYRELIDLGFEARVASQLMSEAGIPGAPTEATLMQPPGAPAPTGQAGGQTTVQMPGAPITPTTGGQVPDEEDRPDLSSEAAIVDYMIDLRNEGMENEEIGQTLVDELLAQGYDEAAAGETIDDFVVRMFALAGLID